MRHQRQKRKSVVTILETPFKGQKMKLTNEQLRQMIKEELESVMVDEGMLDTIKSKLGFGAKPEVDKDAERLEKLDHYVNKPLELGLLGTMTRAFAAGETMAHAKAKHPEKAEEVRRAINAVVDTGGRNQKDFDEGYSSYQQRFGNK